VAYRGFPRPISRATWSGEEGSVGCHSGGQEVCREAHQPLSPSVSDAGGVGAQRLWEDGGGVVPYRREQVRDGQGGVIDGPEVEWVALSGTVVGMEGHPEGGCIAQGKGGPPYPPLPHYRHS
jgi:hypothetical protein